jgi:DNA-directed RNA polymerase specialized sigma24 family protein
MRKLNSVSASEHIQALYRLLLIRTGQRLHAEQALRETLKESRQTPPDPGQTDFVEIYRTALKRPAPASPASDKPQTDLSGWTLALHHLPEPQRSAITLFYLEIFSPRVLSEIFGVDLPELATLISAARKSLDSQQTNSTTA